jgi:hypothetical protein
VPNSPQPVRSSRRARIAAGVIVLTVVAGVTYLLTTKHSPLQPQQPTECAVAAGQDEVQLTVSQAAIAATIAGVAARRDLPVRAVAIAYATALQESKLTDLNYGDRDSVGVFQQRPSEGWGTTQEIENPVYASGRFFSALTAVPHYQRLPVYQAAQDVQHSADGTAYGQYATLGAQLAGAFYGAQPHALWCYYADPPGKARMAAAATALAGTFGPLRLSRLRDPAMVIRVRRPAAGWAVAGWLITHADSYGISDVRYRGYEWLRGHGTGKWVHGPAGPGAQADPDAVVFG